MPVAQLQSANVKHLYEIQVLDVDNKPVQGAKISYSTKINYGAGNNGMECITTVLGACLIEIDVPRDPQYTTLKSFNSAVTYKITKDGYYSDSGNLISSKGMFNAASDSVKRTTVLHSPSDYFAPDFLTSGTDTELRNQTLKFLNSIRAESLLVDADVRAKSIKVETFKSRKYLQIGIVSTTVFNTLKLNKYEIGKRLFDDSVRKILNPLNENVSNPKTFYGYDLKVVGQSRSFAEKYSLPSGTEYRFLMPQDAVKKYKDKDISGQQLLDASVLLMDDERIEMKLQ